MTTDDEFRILLATPEGARVEFKEASGGYHFEELVDYCVALANEGGGKIVFGVTDRRPRRVVGTNAFREPGRTEAGLFEELRQRIPIEELTYEGKRVLIVDVPGRLRGTAWQHKGRFLMRAGDALVPMSDEQLRQIHAETGADFSAEICASARIDDLDGATVDLFRRLWQRKAPAQDLASRSDEQLLADAELLVDGKLTYAALILFGTRAALVRHLAQAEVIFEYRPNDAPGPAADRKEFRTGFLPVLDEVWRLANLRNDLQHFEQGLFVWDVPTFNERAVREALLNAVSHRNYRHGGSVVVRQYPRRIEIVSPGGLPPGITPDNILWQQNPRNRRIAESLARCGLVERAGQGFDLIYREAIRQSKPLPDLSGTDDHFVWLTLHGKIQDPEFLRFLEEIGRERASAFSSIDFLVIDLIHRGQAVPKEMSNRVKFLVEEGVIERVGRGRGTRLLLSRRFYQHLGKTGVYTRKKGLDRETNKALIKRHIQNSRATGARMEELRQVLPSLSRSQIQVLLRELAQRDEIHVRGHTRAAHWYPGRRDEDCN